MPQPAAPRWLLLIHQIPPRPNYLRVKVGRHLQGVGAVAIKNSVYVLPRSDQALEDFQWVRREIHGGGGDATVCEARFVEGRSDTDIETMFGAAREADYASLAEEARRWERALARPRKRAAVRPEQVKRALLRLRKRLSGVSAVDFFGARGREAVEGSLSGIEARLNPRAMEAETHAGSPAGRVRGRTWVTRRGVHVDRIASAWLVRRFIDPDARFKFVLGHDYEPAAGELRFDMFQAEFTHDGDLCTFETLLRRFGLRDRGLRHVGEIVHEIDLKDGRFARPETLGIDRLLAGIAMRCKDDEARLAEGASVFESLYEYFRKKKKR